MIFDRSLTDETFDFDEQEHKNGSSETCLIILERLVDRGFFQNNRQMVVKWDWPSIPGLFRIFRSMAELEKVNLFSCSLTRTDHLPQLFRSCPKLIELHLSLYENPNLEMNEELKNELRSGFQRLRLLELRSYIYPPQPHIIQEIFT
jgi:hypothetical protein